MTAVDSQGWSGDGTFTAYLIETIGGLDGIDGIKVEDSPAGRNEPGYCFVSNEVYVRFTRSTRQETTRRAFLWRTTRTVTEQTMRLADLGRTLTAIDGVGEPDYSDDGMLQYLRTERIVPPYQTKGYKLVELVRIYEAGSARRE